MRGLDELHLVEWGRLEHAYGDARDVPAVRACRPTTAITLARGLLGDRTTGPGGWPEAVAALCAGGAPDWAVDEVLGHARRLRGTDLVDPDLPYLGGDVAGILAATLRLVPAGRATEAVSAVRVLADRARPPFQNRLRAMRDDAQNDPRLLGCPVIVMGEE